MSILQTIFAFIISLAILVSIHEWGHFWVARKMGVKVLKFSIGFGKSLFSWHDKYGTEFSISVIPLGGYVKMLDEREGNVASDEVHLAFNKKNVWKRIAIVAAGPLANFILAFIALWVMYLIGIKTIMPTIGYVIPNSPAALSGITANERIISINHQPVKSWYDVNLSLAGLIGDNTSFPLTTYLNNQTHSYDITIQHWPRDIEKQDLISTIGFKTWSPKVPTVISKVIEGLPANRAGIKSGDQVLSINGQSVYTWKDVVDIVSKSASSSLTFNLLRNHQKISLEVTPEKKTLNSGDVIGFIGAQATPVSWPSDQISNISYNPVTAIPIAAKETWKLTSITLKSLHKIIIGVLSLNNLSGPVTIAKVAGTALRSGIESFLYFIAMLSVSLGVINLLPIPTLDGGHLLFYLIEAVRRRPVPEKIQSFGLRLGLTFILCIMILAIYNDIARL